MVGRGGVDRRLWDQGGNELRELTRVVAILAIRLRGIETKLVEDDRLAAHLDYVEGETDDLRSMIQRVDARIDGLVAMLTARREGVADSLCAAKWVDTSSLLWGQFDRLSLIGRS